MLLHSCWQTADELWVLCGRQEEQQQEADLLLSEERSLPEFCQALLRPQHSHLLLVASL
jgi:hypothetical protein